MPPRQRDGWIPAAFIGAIALLTTGVAIARPVKHSAGREAGRGATKPEISRPAPPRPGSEAPAASCPLEFYASPRMVFEAPVSALLPGNAATPRRVDNPVAGNPEAEQRGMSYFATFNCVGCHAPNAGGGMGPSLSNRFFVYGGDPANIYLSIYQGRPNGMPAWGATLPESVIWDLVAYIEAISKEPRKSWGETLSRDTLKIEQVPAEFVQSTNPWSHTRSFGFGQRPQR